MTDRMTDRMGAEKGNGGKGKAGLRECVVRC
jgi:hypothetical protein